MTATPPALVETAAAAKALDFAAFNEGPHLCVEVPDGNFTITARTSTGEKLTFSFVAYRDDGVPGCVDVQRASGPAHPDRPDLPTFHMIGFCPGVGDVFDTRKAERQMTLATILLGEET